ncbi:MAG TPA: sigma-54 dependent transcriptional regulator [Longimicrobiaceae bacterium]|nr:sigma-54 dependent transcriptional regulator [Longimicrobiaceae bacterium]
MRAFVGLAADCCHPVILYGETGAGKTYLAKELHRCGPRADRPFVRVNCAAIPESLFEREMFGHVRGAFTDAREGGEGLFEAADGGILFLDEIGEIPLNVQAKLLAVLEEGVIRRLGSMREVLVDVRVVAATNHDLAEMVRQKRFRQDLYYRLSVLQYRVPSLRERRDEIPAIVEHVLRDGSTGAESPICPEALAVILDYPWPGNIRELENALAAAAVFACGAVIRPQHLPPDLRAWGRSMATRRAGSVSERDSARYTAPGDPLREMEEIRLALQACGGNKAAAARRLGMARSTLWAKLRAFGYREGATEVARGDAGEAAETVVSLAGRGGASQAPPSGGSGAPTV